MMEGFLITVIALLVVAILWLVEGWDPRELIKFDVNLKWW